MPGSQIDNRGRNEKGRNPARPAVQQLAVLAFDDVQPADPGGNIHADFVEVRLLWFPVGHAHRKIRAGQSDLDEPPHFFQFFFLDPLEGVEVFHFTRDAAVETGGVKAGDGSDATDAGQKILPTFLRADAQRADQSNTRDHNAARQRFLLPNEVVLPSGLTSLWSVYRYSRPRPLRSSSSRRPRRAPRCRTLPRTPSPIPLGPANPPPGRPQTMLWASPPLHPRRAARR